MANIGFTYTTDVNISREFIADWMSGDEWASSQIIRLADEYAEDIGFTFAILETCLKLIKPEDIVENIDSEDVKTIVGLCSKIVKAVKND